MHEYYKNKRDKLKKDDEGLFGACKYRIGKYRFEGL